jgi:hypothetical protein
LLKVVAGAKEELHQGSIEALRRCGIPHVIAMQCETAKGNPAAVNFIRQNFPLSERLYDDMFVRTSRGHSSANVSLYPLEGPARIRVTKVKYFSGDL